MDLTSGYHQAPLAEQSRIFTAFISAFGIYEWCRVVMGLKGACSYFQRMMTTEVLRGLIHELCEVYLDDVVVGGTTTHDFLHNLRQVFMRFRQFNITLNPDKCRFGLKEIEYVGRVISQEGLTFTRDKIDSVVNFPCPRTHKDLKSFLGLANYFREHVPHHSSVAAPLTALVLNYRPGKSLVWNDRAKAAFEEMKALIDKCPKLFFQSPDGEIFLQTDASNDGIGAYLFQRIFSEDGTYKDLPIEFISKAFSKEQKRWSTNEQEAYAIFYALRKLEHLLRDVKFVLQTDHKNLVYVNCGASPKVKRWKLALQEYNFDIEHIAGKLNVVADAFSRLCFFSEDTTLDKAICDEYILHLYNEAEWDNELFDYDGPIYHHGVEQFFSLEEEVLETRARRASKKRSGKRPLHMPKEIYDLIKSAHNALTGHSGVRRTLARLRKQDVSFPNMRTHVDQFIKQCPFCQKTTHKAAPAAHPLPFTLAKYGTMSKLNIDSIGPLKKDAEGYEHILVVIDAFSRWIMLYPLKTLLAQECAQAMIQHFGIFGAAAQITSDGGPQISNTLIDQVIGLVGAQHKVTLAYSHEENAIVERANQEVVRYLRAFLFEQTVIRSWRMYVPFVQRICNTEVISSLGVSPARILFGSAVDLDRGIVVPHKTFECSDHGDLMEYTKQLIAAQKATIDYASKHQMLKDAAHMSAVTAKIVEVTSYPVGSYVLCDHGSGGFTKKALPPHKLMTSLRGPLKVVSNDGAAYVLLDVASGRAVHAHVSRLRPFLYDPLQVDPVSVCAKDHDQWIVEYVDQHRGYNVASDTVYTWTGKCAFKKHSELQLYVKWIGSDERTWENWTHNLNSNVQAHEYMRRFPHLKRLIAPHFQEAYEAQEAP